MSCGAYIPSIKAEFGRTITDDEINFEFQAIEQFFACLCEAAGDSSVDIETVVDLGTVIDNVVINSSFGVVQYLTIEGDVQIDFAIPQETDPKLITLVIADGGNGRFNLPAGMAWTSDVSGLSIDGYPWDPQGLGGDYGAIVTCVYDNTGWIYIVFARHDIDLSVSPRLIDIYNWR